MVHWISPMVGNFSWELQKRVGGSWRRDHVALDGPENRRLASHWILESHGWCWTLGVDHYGLNSAASASLAYRRSLSTDGFVDLVTLQHVQTENWSRTYFCPHRLARGAGKLEANEWRGQPQSKQTWSPSPNRESRCACWRKDWTNVSNELAQDHRVWNASIRDPPAQPTADEYHHRYK